MKHRVAVPIPICGREPLLAKTISRLKRQTHPVYKIIGVGQTESERKCCEDNGAVFYYHRNSPLSAKWQFGVDIARNLGATDILILGSSDWISDRWVECCLKFIDEGYDLVGKKEIYFLDIQPHNKKRMLLWKTYTEYFRKDEPMGAGRIISNRILEKLKWQIFDYVLEMSLDYNTYKRIVDSCGFVKTISTNKIHSLSISCYYKWINKHPFYRFINKPNVVNIKNVDEILSYWFPDALNLFGDDYERRRRNI